MRSLAQFSSERLRHSVSQICVGSRERQNGPSLRLPTDEYVFNELTAKIKASANDEEIKVRSSGSFIDHRSVLEAGWWFLLALASRWLFFVARPRCPGLNFASGVAVTLTTTWENYTYSEDLISSSFFSIGRWRSRIPIQQHSVSGNFHYHTFPPEFIFLKLLYTCIQSWRHNLFADNSNRSLRIYRSEYNLPQFDLKSLCMSKHN